MSNNRSFVDFGRQRQLSDYGIRTISSAPPDGEYGLGAVDLALHLDRMIEQAFNQDPHDMAEMAVESHTPQAVERPMTRKESHEDWLKRTSALIDECQKARE